MLSLVPKGFVPLQPLIFNMSTNRFHFLVYLTFLSVIGFLATDMYLPAFSQMYQDFGTSKSTIGLSLTLFLGGFAVAQLLWGPISDRIGKPKAIVWGLSLFALASLGIFFTHNIFIFLGLRLVQAVGGCAAAVSWQALVVERYSAERTKKVFAGIMPLVALSPALAPLVGVYILEHFGWRYIFISLAIIALLLVLYSLLLVGESHPEKPKSPPKAYSYLNFFKSKKYIGNVMVYAFTSAGFFAWLTGAPFFLKELGYDEAEIGLSFVPQTIAFMMGGYGYRMLTGKIEGKKLLPSLLVLYSLCMLALLGLAVFTVPTLTMLLIPFCLMAFTNGATYPIAVAEALGPYKENSGSASALQNTLQLGSCFVASAFVSLFSHQALLATTVVMAATVIFVFIGFRWSKAEN